MLTFKQFLVESKWEDYVYHATYEKDWKPHVGMHVGTLRAAMARAYATQSHEDPEWGDDYEGNVRRHLVVHAFKYNPGIGKALVAQDFEEGGSPTEIANWLDEIDWLDKEDYKKIYKSRDTGHVQDGIKSAMRKKGYSHVKYKNEIEDPGSWSHIILSPDDLQHVKSFKAPKFVSRKYPHKKETGSKWRMTLPYFSRTRKERKIGRCRFSQQKASDGSKCGERAAK